MFIFERSHDFLICKKDCYGAIKKIGEQSNVILLPYVKDISILKIEFMIDWNTLKVIIPLKKFKSSSYLSEWHQILKYITKDDMTLKLWLWQKQ